MVRQPDPEHDLPYLAGILIPSLVAMEKEVEASRDQIEKVLAPYIDAWEKIEPVPCGYTGGWSFDGVGDGRVVLKHECFYAHRYDLHDQYSTSPLLTDLIAGTKP